MAGEETVWARLTRLFRSGPVVRHKIANAERMQSPQGTARAFKKELSSLYVRALASYANYERLSRYCVTGDTLVAVNLEEGNIRIDQLVDRIAAGEDIRVFSYDADLDELVAAPIERAVYNGEREVCEVELDDGSVVRCTLDHRFMLRDGSYREAQDLTPNTALMPFHRKEWGGRRGEYRYVYSYSRGWIPEHVVVAESVSGERYTRDGGIHIHHKNFKHRDNSSTNLQPLPTSEHLALHARINNKRFEDPLERDRQAITARARWAPGGDLRRLQESGELVSEAGREVHRRTMAEVNRAHRPGRGNAGRTDQGGLDNANADRSLTYQMICDAYHPDIELPELCKKLGASRYKVLKRLGWTGYSSFDDFQERYTNHKVVAVRMTGAVERVYDLTVSPHHNFAISSQCGKSLIIIHNSDYNEMEYTPELHSALDIYADEATVKNDDRNVIEVISKNAEIKEILETFFFDVLNINFNSWSWMRHFCKFGDFVLFVDANEENGILNLYPIPINEIEREEGFDPKDPMAVRFRWLTRGNTILEAWQVVHFRLLGNDAYLPYGSSVLEPARRIWRQLVLIEDAMLVYRIVRSPERRVFHIEIANTPPDQVDAFIEQVKTQMKRSTITDSETGRVDLRYNPLPIRRDTPVPLLDGRTLTIEEMAAEFGAGKTNWVYSIQDGTKRVVPGKVVWCGKNYVCDRIHRVWLDDGSYVDVAPEHPFVMRDGTSRRADELTSGDSLMPIVRDVSSKEAGDFLDGYERVLDQSTGEYAASRPVPQNHQVVRVEVLDGVSDDVFCMTVVGIDGEEDRHNFAVQGQGGGQGLVIVKNSVEEDYFLPKRGEQKSEIGTLSGGQFPVRRDSLIPLLDGRVITIEQLAAEYAAGKENWVYSVQDGTLSVVPGRVIWCGKNYVCDRLHRVWLDDGSYVDMAPEHPIVMRDGSKLRADEVRPGQSVMPFRSSIGTLGDYTYRTVRDPSDDEWRFVHRLVAGPHGISDAMARTGERHVALHHVDFDRFNNRPDNLRWMGRLEHVHLHGENARRNLHTPELMRRAGERLREYNRSDVGRDATALRNSARWDDPGFRAAHSGQNHWNVRKWATRYDALTPADLARFCLERGIASFKALLGDDGRPFRTDEQVRAFLRHHGIESWTAFAAGHLAQAPQNHRIVRVEVLEGVSDEVFCMTVVGPSGEDDRHNFAVLGQGIERASGELDGIFVRNTGDIEDVRYIQSKMFSAIKIPRAYLGYEDQLGSKATLSQEDVRFSKTIERIQELFISELNKIAIIHLYLLGYSGDDLVNFEIRMGAPSTIAAQQRLELWRMKLEVAGMAQEGIFDRGFIYRNIFDLNDRQIAQIQDGKRIDKLEDALLQGMEAPPPGPEAAPPGQGPAPAEPTPGAEELPDTLGGPAPAPAENPPPAAPVTAGLLRPGRLVEKFNPGSTGNDASIAVDKGKDLFSTGEDHFNLTFGTEKQTASDPYDRRAGRRLIGRPFSENQGADIPLAPPDEGGLNPPDRKMSAEIDEAEEMLEGISLWLDRRD